MMLVIMVYILCSSILDSEVEMTTDDSCNEMSQSMPPPSTTIDNVDSKVYGKLINNE